MRVVIFCGGLGVRMGETALRTPKPMIKLGNQPILWHIMKWYASWGHTDFVLCLGYRSEAIKEYFLTYDEAYGNDFVLNRGSVKLLGSDMDTWRITLIETGIQASVGERLWAARDHVGEDDVFLCTYGDGLTDAPLDVMIDRLVRSEKTGMFMSVRPRLSYHVVDSDDSGHIRSIDPIHSSGVRINGGFFVFRRRIFDLLRPGEDFMDDVARLASRGDMLAYRYDGFWAAMDTMKDKQDLEAIVERGNGTIPWLRRVAGREQDGSGDQSRLGPAVALG